MRTLAIVIMAAIFVMLCIAVAGNDAGSAVEIGLLK